MNAVAFLCLLLNVTLPPPIPAAADIWIIHMLQCISIHVHISADKDIHWTLPTPLLLSMASEATSLCL